MTTSMRISPSVSVSWDALVTRLRAFIARRAHAADVDDILQEVLVRVHTRLDALDDHERFDAWVFRIARNCIADAGRARGKLALDAGVADTEAPTLDDERDRDEIRTCLVGCLARLVAELPAPYRQALTLTELEGLTQEEAARVEGVSLSGMKSRVQRGRRRLRELYDACCLITQDARGTPRTCDTWPSSSSSSSCECGPR